jgi:archaellum biogenesis ATPase FlaH
MGNSPTKDPIEHWETAMEYDGPDRWVHFADYLKEKSKNLHAGIRFDTGWTDFDYFTDGLSTRELMVVSGIEGNGKSLFCRSLMRKLLQQEIPVGFMSFEGNLKDTLKDFQAEPNLRMFLPLELKAGEPAWVIEQCLRFKAKHDGKVVILDHLHYMIDMNIQQNVSLNIGAFVRTLVTDVCSKLNMLVVLVAHQQSIDTKKIEPGIETVRDSSFLRQEPDLFITVHRQLDPGMAENPAAERSYEGGFAFVKIDKARRKGTYRKKLTFQKRGAWLEPDL